MNITRNIDQPDEGEASSKWHVDVLLSRSNSYELSMQQNSPGFDRDAQASFPANTNGALVQDVLKLLKSNE